MSCICSALLLLSSDSIKTRFHNLETFYPLSGTQSYTSCVCTGHCWAALLIWPGLMVLGWSPVCVNGRFTEGWRGGLAWLVYSLNFSRTAGLTQYMWQGKMWGLRGRSGSSRHCLRTVGRVSICLSVGNSSQVGGVWRQTLLHAGSGDICHVWVTYLRNQ